VFRFYLDEDLPPSAAEAARRMGLDAVAAREVGPTPRPEPVHLAAAAADGRTVVTYNRNDFIEATRSAFAVGAPHRGVIILTRLPRDPGRIARVLRDWVDAQEGPLPDYAILFLP
jgi:predicted nuclease of predicted toxin-antitoxin system